MFESLEAFQEAAKKEMKKPEGSLKMLVGALMTIETDVKLASQMLTLLVSKKDLVVDKKSPTGFKVNPAIKRLVDNLKFKKYVAKSYAGGTPENGYQCDIENIKLNILKNQCVIEEDKAKLMVKSGGKDSPTPIKLAINNEGLWKIPGSGNLSSMTTGVKKPAEDPKDI